MFKLIGLVIAGGSALVLSGCQTTAQHATPPCLPSAPVPAFAPPPQQYPSPQPSSASGFETQPPPLAMPKKVSAPTSKPNDPPKLERVA